MNCPRCRHRNQPDAAFCDECGMQLEGTCPSCMASNRRDAKFCRVCGYPLLGLPAELSPTPIAARPMGAADERNLASSGVEGERKQVTVLFADTKGSMELIAFRDPEDARRILDPVLELDDDGRQLLRRDGHQVER